MTPTELITSINLLTAIEEVRTRQLVDRTHADKYISNLKSKIEAELQNEPMLTETTTATTTKARTGLFRRK